MIIKLVFLMVGIFFLTIVATGKGNKLLGNMSGVFSGMEP